MQNEGFKLDPVRQGAQTMSIPMKELKADLMAKNLNYNNNPITKWCLSNTVIKSDDNENIRPVKGKNQKQRIDGTVSLIDAYVALFRNLDDINNLM
jgi:phage terminase large subunit-like protein